MARGPPPPVDLTWCRRLYFAWHAHASPLRRAPPRQVSWRGLGLFSGRFVTAEPRFCRFPPSNRGGKSLGCYISAPPPGPPTPTEQATTEPCGQQPAVDKLGPVRACLTTGPARPCPQRAAHRRLEASQVPPIPTLSGGEGRSEGKANPRSSSSTWCFASSICRAEPGHRIGPVGQVTPCRSSPVHAGYALRGVWLSLSLALCASSVGPTLHLASGRDVSRTCN